MKSLSLYILAALLLPAAALAQPDSNVALLFRWSDSTLAGSTAYNNTYNEIWGLVQGGREYAVIGSTAGTHIFDVTDPVNSYLADFVPGAAQGGNIIHRDYHDYNGYLYMACDEGESSLQIADLSYLPDSVQVVYDSKAAFKRAHNIFIDSATARLYVCSVFSDARGYNGLEIFSLADPLNPLLLLEYPDIGTVHDIFVRNDTAWCHNAGNGMKVIDFSNVSSPNLIGNLNLYPDKGYNHSGWLSDDGKTYVMADENHGYRLKLLDVSDLSTISVLSAFSSGVDSMSMAHNPLIRGNLLHVGYYHDGYRLFDITDPSDPVQLGYYDTYLPPDHDSYRGAWGCYPFLPSGIVLVSDMQSGLFVLDISMAVGTTAGRQALPAADLFLYPNPATGSFIVRAPAAAWGKDAVAELTDALGKVIHTEKLNGKELLEIALPPDCFPAGIYLLRLRDAIHASARRLAVR